MPSAQRSVHIARPVHEVFAFFTDAANETRWRSAHLKEFRAEGPLAVGTRIRPVAEGTEVTLRLDAPLGGVKKLLMGASVQKAMNGEVAALETAKAVLES